jgi:LacI family transcriptional regulator
LPTHQSKEDRQSFETFRNSSINLANIRDVAKAAGVSIATVSATVNGSSPVGEATKNRVLEAIKTVGYSPNPMARSLRSGRSRLIGLVLGDVANPFWGSVLRVVEKAALGAGYSVIVCNTDGDEERELSALEQLRAQHVAGILLTPIGNGRAFLDRVGRGDMPPIVTLDHKVVGLARDFVGVDNRAASRMLTEYLLRLGHRRIAILHAWPGLWTSDERLSAFVETMSDAGIEVDPSICVAADYDGDLAYGAVTRLLTQPDRPTAIFGANNIMALGALQAIVDLGYRCPADVSLVGIDDVPWSRLVRPRITAATQPIDLVSRQAVDWLIERISGNNAPPRVRIFQPDLIVGESCAEIVADNKYMMRAERSVGEQSVSSIAV